MSILRIATFNVNSLKSRLPVVERLLTADDSPDIICFQETKCQDREFPAAFFRERGYAVAFSGMKSYNGVAVASRRQADDVTFGFSDGEDLEQDRARLAIARFGGLSIACSYVPQGKVMESPDFHYKLRFFERLKMLFDRRFKATGRLLWTGDINVAPEDMDVTHPEKKRDHVCCCLEAKAALQDVLSWGFVDVYRKHRPNPGEFSFWDYRVPGALERNIGWRIDHLFATESLALCSRDAYAMLELRAMERPSDHTAVIGVFET
ncbi:MAG: exodeoxyribonuclease III [Synergistaceae bacterium]|jgi:exodeoxyribonuclease-3|nr:exodeoxyribonuclease III [Synergistaceae bacterium]